MTSDPNESAAWRAFAMLDSDEAASFDDAARRNPELAEAYREMNCLAAAVAAVSVTPLPPKAGQIDRLHARLGLNTSKRTNWMGISGWGAAAVLTFALVLNRNSEPASPVAVGPPQRSSGSLDEPARRSSQRMPEDSPSARDTAANPSPKQSLPPGNPENEVKSIVKTETKRLIQEIEVLREKLESAQDRDRMLFEAIPGRAWPVIMRMSPPEVAANPQENQFAAAREEGASALTALIADALAGNHQELVAQQEPFSKFENSTNRAAPSAIPIYDAARDNGTLVVNNLPKPQPDESYNLWVTTEEGARPIHVGRLPASDTPGADSFDFSLGSKAVVPSGFLLTKDPLESITAPSESNTVLQGPR